MGAECGDDCKAKGGKCYRALQRRPANDYLGMCREGKWPNMCYCGFCYARPCRQVFSGCKGRCSRRSPGRDWTVTGTCDRGNSGCKCWERKKSCPQTPNCKSKVGPGWCGPDHPRSDGDEKLGPCDPFNKQCVCWKCLQDTDCTSVGGYCSTKLPTSNSAEKRCRHGCYCHGMK